jgi:KTSC domain-containing protein
VDRKTVESSMIASIGHEPLTNTLEVEFKGGTVHQYANVTAEEHKALVAAESIGKHFNANIKGKKENTKL